jgi:hypothetical protein
MIKVHDHVLSFKDRLSRDPIRRGALGQNGSNVMRDFCESLALSMRGMLSCFVVTIVLQTNIAMAQSGANQNSAGDCSPNIIGGGNVTVVCPPNRGGDTQLPCDPASEGALSNWNARILQNQANWGALVNFGEAKVYLLDTYCNKASKITKERLATTHGLLGISYFNVGNKQRACRSLARASSYYSDIGKDDDRSDMADVMRKIGC